MSLETSAHPPPHPLHARCFLFPFSALLSDVAGPVRSCPSSFQVDRKGEELEAVRLQLAKSEGALQQVSTLKADVEDLRRALQGERESAEKAASEARQEADVVKQLRCVFWW